MTQIAPQLAPRIAPLRIRNVALVGHGGTGKTTLAEAMLFTAGAIGRRGRVEDGTTVCDADPEEHERGQSLSLAMAPLEWNDHRINLIDTPGYADFEGEAAAALHVADLAVFVVSAVEGVEVQTERLWQVAARRGLPRMVFINKLDRERASFERTLEQLRQLFGAGVAPLELPIGSESSFRGIADLLTDTAALYEDETGRATPGPIPEEMETREHEVHDNLVEGIVVADDALLERYLDGDVPSVEELERALAVGIDEAKVFPVVCGSALQDIAVDRLMDLLCEIGPAPQDLPPVEVQAGGATVSVAPDPSADPLAFVFKTIADPFVGQLSLFKVLSGTIRTDDHLVNTRTRTDERLHGLFRLRGHEQIPVTELQAGDIGAVAKLSDTTTGDTLAPKHLPVVAPPIERGEAALAVAVIARTQADDDKLATALHRLVAEDPSIVVVRDDDTRQTLVKGMGETHLQITLERLARKFGVHVDTEEVKVAYRETVTAAARGEGRHKKQSGGHGQFGVCVLAIEPLERGAGFEFVDKIVGGAIPRQFISAVERGVVEAMADGGPHGHPVVDVRVTCVDGKFHAVDSSEMSFKMAGRLGFREAMNEAAPVVLEPISHLAVTVPTDQAGDVMGDLHARRAHVLGTEAVDDDQPGGHAAGTGLQVVSAFVPTAEIRRYAIDLRSKTSGRGTFHARHDHYDVLPEHLVASVAELVAEPAGPH